jgi:hypothetical protein
MLEAKDIDLLTGGSGINLAPIVELLLHDMVLPAKCDDCFKRSLS